MKGSIIVKKVLQSALNNGISKGLNPMRMFVCYLN